jgi:hypothetical protein
MGRGEHPWKNHHKNLKFQIFKSQIPGIPQMGFGIYYLEFINKIDILEKCQKKVKKN